MSFNVPIYNKFSWASLPPQFLVIGIFSFVAYLIGLNEILNLQGVIASVMYGAIGQLVVWYGVRSIVAKFHKQGMDLVKQEKFTEAIPLFIDSLEMFAKYSWVDKYRYFLISSSKMSYREMDLNNIAFCYAQIGEKEKAIQFYKQTLQEFPNSGMAKAALNFINTFTNNIKQAD